MKRGAALVLALAAFPAASIGSASAITNGTADGNGHPNVGALLAEFGPPGQRTFSAQGP